MTKVQQRAAACRTRCGLTAALANSLCILVLAAVTAFLSSCGNSSSSSEPTGALTGNWQITMTPTSGSSFIGSPLQGGFLLQQNGSVTGQIVLSITTSSGVCNTGVATVTGTVSGRTATISLAVNTLNSGGNPTTQTLTLSGGQLGTNSLGTPTIQGTSFAFSADGYGQVNGSLVPCGLGADTGTWSATSYPPVTGAIQGFFHSFTGNAGLNGQEFPLLGNIVQGPNSGASYASISGSLVFQSANQGSDYPCLTTASVNGVISGNNVSLQIYGTNGLVVGQIGTGGSPPAGVSINPVTLTNSTTGGLVIQGQLGYALTTKSCPQGSALIGDTGNICLALGNSTGCTQPITLSPLSTIFLPQLLGSTPTQQTITISNITSSPLANVKVQLTGNDSLFFYPQGGGDFTGAPNFTVVQTGQANDCTTLAPLGTAFTLATSCEITVQFSPQESCPWLPASYLGNSTPPFVENPSLCPNPVSDTLTVNVPSGDTEDSDGTFSTPISGTGLSAIVPSTGELDFGSETIGETGPPQTITFTNQGSNAVQILPGADTCNTLNQQNLPYPLTIASPVAGFQIDRIGFPQAPNTQQEALIQPQPSTTPPTVSYACDFDTQSKTQNFQIAPAPASTCLAAGQGVILQPLQSCTLQIAFAPQPEAWNTIPINGAIGLDYFLEFNTVQCNSGESNCEIDSGRFPVELKTEPPSPLRLLPAAGVDFGTLTEGTLSAPVNVTLFNDPIDPNSATVTITSKIVSGDYLELDNCPSSLAPNDSCAITFNFKPKVIGFDHSTFTINYNTPTQSGLVQTIFLRGAGQ